MLTSVIRRDRATRRDEVIDVYRFQSTMRANKRNVAACVESLEMGYEVHTIHASYRQGGVGL